jgi:hypothetical protein
MIVRLFALFFGIFLITGCGSNYLPNPVKIKGKVYLPDGNPVALGTITFEPFDVMTGTDVSTEITEGNFDLSIHPGKYRIAIEPAGRRAGKKITSSAIPRQYWDSGKSKLELEVKSGSNPDLEYKLIK